jgi:predicted O-methyltransferase YrrM
MTESLDIDKADNPWPEQYPDLKLPAGSLSRKDAECLLKYSDDVKRVIEAGTFKGRSAAIMSLGADDVVTLDKWNGNSEEDARRELARFPNVEVLTRDGRDGLHYLPKPELLFIDVQHDYEDTIDVFHAWFRGLAVGAHIIFHDFTQLYPGVIRAFNEVRGRRDIEYVTTMGWCGVVRKTR